MLGFKPLQIAKRITLLNKLMLSLWKLIVGKGLFFNFILMYLYGCI